MEKQQYSPEMQVYAQLCAELGERVNQKEMLEREIQVLLGKVGQAQAALAPSPQSAETPAKTEEKAA